MLIVRGAESPIPCKIRPSTIISKLVAVTQIKLAIINKVNPIYTTGFLPKLSDKGPKSNGPIPKPRKIMVTNSWLFTILVTPISIPIISKAGNNASIDNATTDINDAIRATNSNCEVGCLVFTDAKVGAIKRKASVILK